MNPHIILQDSFLWTCYRIFVNYINKGNPSAFGRWTECSGMTLVQNNMNQIKDEVDRTSNYATDG